MKELFNYQIHLSTNPQHHEMQKTYTQAKGIKKQPLVEL